MRRPVEFDDWPAQLDARFGPYRAVVRHIVDGDTLDCLVDVGFNDYLYRTIRLAEIDAPERNRLVTREAGLAAQAFLEELVPVGSKVLLYTAPDPDSFGRYIAVVERGDFLDVNEAMVAAGHAVKREYS